MSRRPWHRNQSSVYCSIIYQQRGLQVKHISLRYIAWVQSCSTVRVFYIISRYAVGCLAVSRGASDIYGDLSRVTWRVPHHDNAGAEEKICRLFVQRLGREVDRRAEVQPGQERKAGYLMGKTGMGPLKYKRAHRYRCGRRDQDKQTKINQLCQNNYRLRVAQLFFGGNSLDSKLSTAAAVPAISSKSFKRWV